MALKLFEAFVEIRGKLEPLKRSLRLAKTAVSGAIRSMNKMFSAVYNTAAKAFKRVALAITGIYAASIKAFSSVAAQAALSDTAEEFRQLLDAHKGIIQDAYCFMHYVCSYIPGAL